MILWQQNIFALDWREEYCSEDRVCLIYEQNGYTVDLYLQNKFITDDIITTVTLAHTAGPVNLTGQAPLPATMVCRGTKPLKAASFTIIDYSKAWNTNLNYYWQYGAPASTEDTKYAYNLPFEKGRRFRVCQAFNDTLTHSGESAYAIDWQMPAGTPICAARSGVVIYTVTKYSTGGLTPAYKNKDNLVIILHSDGSMARYAHMKHNGVTVQTGDRVEAGSVIAYSGNTGYSASPHLHFDIFRPLDGKNSATIPFGFITDYADYEVPEKGGFYTFTGASPKKLKTLVDMDDVLFCREISAGEPVPVAAAFTSKDKFQIYIPLYATRHYDLQIRLFKDNSPVPVLVSGWQIQQGWWYACLPVDLSRVPQPAGKWQAEISIDEIMLGVKSFTVAF